MAAAKSKAKKAEPEKPKENVVTQMFLAAYYARHAKIDELDKEEKRDREVLISSLRTSARVEDGPFLAIVEAVQQARTDTKRLFEEIAQRWGVAAAEELKAAVTTSSGHDRVVVRQK